MPLRTVVIVGDENERAQAAAACRQIGLALEGCTASGHEGLALMQSLATPPDLVILGLRLPDMDGADMIAQLAAQGRQTGLIAGGAGCPRIHDTALMLAAALGVRHCAALNGAISAVTLGAAVADCMSGSARSTAAPLMPAELLPALDAVDIRSGLLRDEFELHYQPKVTLADCNPRGYEALLRWRHPRHGLLGPGSFLAQAEKADLVELLTMKVLRMALDNCLALRAAGLQHPIAVNLSPLSLANPCLAGQIDQALRRARLPASAIVFEITEYSEIADLSVALRVLLKMRLNGHRLSLDDYGAGHASILQMSRIPFSEMKLDQRLVHNAWKRPHLEPLLRQAIASARELGVTSVAEGIETREDWNFMRRLGCDQAQGYLIARPMPVGLLPAWRPALTLSAPADIQMAATTPSA